MKKYLIRRLQTPCAGLVDCGQGVFHGSEYFSTEVVISPCDDGFYLSHSGFDMKKLTLITTVLTACMLLLAAVMYCSADAVERTSAKNPGSMKVHKTAEWEGEWLSVASQVDALEKRGIFRKAAEISKSYSADEIKKYFQSDARENIMRVKINKGVFSFMNTEGTVILGRARYTYEGFHERMMEGREVQWHRFRIAEGYDKYPELICSEPYGFLGQWILLINTKEFNSARGENSAAYLQSMMFPAGISPEAIADIADNHEFIKGLVTLLPDKK